MVAPVTDTSPSGSYNLNREISNLNMLLSTEEWQERKEIGYLLFLYVVDYNGILQIIGRPSFIRTEAGKTLIENTMAFNHVTNTFRGGLAEIPFNPITEKFEIQTQDIQLWNLNHSSPESFVEFCRQAQCYSNGSCKYEKVVDENNCVKCRALV